MPLNERVLQDCRLPVWRVVPTPPDCIWRLLRHRAIAASSVMSGVAVIMGIGLWYTEDVALYLFRQPDKVARVRMLNLHQALRLLSVARFITAATPSRL